jgi:endo-1,4-beta-D-glucanase Y
MNRLSAGLVLGVAVSSLAPAGHAQNKPFPQNVQYVKGFASKNISARQVRAVYDIWKRQYLKADCGSGYYRVEFGDPFGTTVSEGMGYGMLLTAYFGDRAEFDGLWKFVQKNRNPNGVMGWKVNCSGPLTSDGIWGQNAATDGDLDIALALVAAIDQWGDTYRAQATDYIAAIKRSQFTTCSQTGRVVQKPGDSFGGCDFGNSSYWMPGYYRVFQELTGDAFWGTAADDSYELFFANRHATTGFNSNEVDQYGNIANGQNFVNYNGCRTPWRIVSDYLWFGTARAKDMTDKLTDWADSVGIQSVVDGYNVDGTRAAGSEWNKSNPWTGAWAAGAMSKSQDRVDRFTTHFLSCNDDDGYYDTSLRALYMLTVSGNFWKPGTPATAHGGDYDYDPSQSSGTGGSGSVEPRGGTLDAGGDPEAEAAGGEVASAANGCSLAAAPRSRPRAWLLVGLLIPVMLRRRLAAWSAPGR